MGDAAETMVWLALGAGVCIGLALGALIAAICWGCSHRCHDDEALEDEDA